jgi:hypothetical protein
MVLAVGSSIQAVVEVRELADRAQECVHYQNMECFCSDPLLRHIVNATLKFFFLPLSASA